MIREKDIVRERIISAAMKIFSKHGFFKAPVHLIAREAGVSKGLVFWYFRNKQELIIEVAKRSLPLDIIDSCIEKSLVGRNMLECIGRGYMNKYRDPVHRGLLLHTMALETQSWEIAEDIRRLCEEKIVVIAERVFGKPSTKAKIALRAFFGGLMCYVLRPPKDIDEQTFLENLIDIVLVSN
ncbi:MAG: TetR/AcrR family transcriptional regulator [Desulfurococcales archaeon]|nr:TetR/AcrR family transcriptional regulator [Desulfurococcales archaeon]